MIQGRIFFEEKAQGNVTKAADIAPLTVTAARAVTDIILKDTLPQRVDEDENADKPKRKLPAFLTGLGSAPPRSESDPHQPSAMPKTNNPATSKPASTQKPAQVTAAVSDDRSDSIHNIASVDIAVASTRSGHTPSHQQPNPPAAAPKKSPPKVTSNVPPPTSKVVAPDASQSKSKPSAPMKSKTDAGSQDKSVIFKGVVFVLSGFQNPLRDNVC